MYKLDYWSKKGILCQESIDETLDLLNQTIAAKIISDSISIQLNSSLYKVKNEVDNEKIKRSELEGQNKELRNIVLTLNDKVNKLHRDKAIAWGTGFAAVIATIFIMK